MEALRSAAAQAPPRAAAPRSGAARPALSPAAPLAGSRRRAVALPPSAGRLGFHEEVESAELAAPPPSALYGLSGSQMEALGLTSEDVVRRLAATEVRARGGRRRAS